MKHLVLYATYSGGTQIAGQIVCDTLKSNSSNTVTVKTPAEIAPDDLNAYDAITLCTPTWDFQGKEGQPHEDYLNFMKKSREKSWDGKRFAILGLGDSTYTHFCGSVDVLEKFVSDAKGKLIVPSLRIDGFFYNQEKNSEIIKSWAETLSTALAQP